MWFLPEKMRNCAEIARAGFETQSTPDNNNNNNNNFLL